tara:strand:- start:213 stop:377 length:165 start_codon:yes stop_codon:yes gene_type:complete
MAQIRASIAQICCSSLKNEEIAKIIAIGTKIMLNAKILITPKTKPTIPSVGEGP